MTPIDPVRISKTMAFLLRHRPEVGGLEPDAKGWVELDALVSAVSLLLKVEIRLNTLTFIVEDSNIRRFEIVSGRIRAVEHRRSQARPPDITYHATTEAQIESFRSNNRIAIDDHPVYLSTDEAQAWRAAHRLGGVPRVLYIDTSRARRHGARISRNRRTGLYMVPSLAIGDALNLLPCFEEQISAGGIPVTRGEDGQVRMALIRVTRRSGVTWEVAKGKLEEGEPPEHAAVREVREEMGIDVNLTIHSLVGLVRYGFMAPRGLPRLKTVFLYLMEPEKTITADFRPSTREGIGEVRWFTPREACQVVRHSSLVPLMRRACRAVEANWRA